jgi:recombination protein RecA
MAAGKKRKLEATVTALRKRWGVRVIQRLGEEKERPVATVATGFPALDEALGGGGIPRGRISEIIGIPTSGMATLALKIVAHGQSSGTAVYLDLERTLDPDYAARCGVDLQRLIIVRPYDERQALAILHDFVVGGGLSVLVFDAPFRLLAEAGPAEALAQALGRILTPLARSDCALLFLTALPPNSAPSLDAYPQHVALPHYTAVRLLIQRESWFYYRQDIHGYQAQVAIVKNKLGAAGGQVRLAIDFKESL